MTRDEAMRLPILTVSGPELVHWLDRIGRLRADVWQATRLIDPDAFPVDRWTDRLDEDATHWVIVDGDTPVAAMRYAQFDDPADMPDAAHHRALGLWLVPPVALPERLVVHPRLQHLGLATRLADHGLAHAIASGARSIVSEASAPTAEMLRKRGRRVLGPAAYDPRFPGVSFQLVLTEIGPDGSVR